MSDLVGNLEGGFSYDTAIYVTILSHYRREGDIDFLNALVKEINEEVSFLK